jgi:hypothetical protein
MGLTTSLIALTLLQPGQLGAEIYHDFRAGQPLPASFRVIGHDGGKYTKPEQGGFRITIPADRKFVHDRVGLEMAGPFKGDFEVTAGYELLHADAPTNGYGVGVELFVHMSAKPTEDGMGLYRVKRVNEGDDYMVSRNSMENGKGRYLQRHFPTSCTKGKLRITRRGADATNWVAEGDSDNFKELCRYELGSDPVKMIWFTGFTGHFGYDVDLRIVDVRVRTDVPVAEQTAGPRFLADDQQDNVAGKSWLALYLAAGMGITVGLVLCALLYLGLRRRRAAGGDRATATAALRCSGCGRALRTSAAHAGKRVRCPQCGQASVVPLNEVGQA